MGGWLSKISLFGDVNYVHSFDQAALVVISFNTVFTRFGVYFQIQSETETIDFPVDFDMAAVRGVNAPRW